MADLKKNYFELYRSTAPEEKKEPKVLKEKSKESSEDLPIDALSDLNAGRKTRRENEIIKSKLTPDQEKRIEEDVDDSFTGGLILKNVFNIIKQFNRPLSGLITAADEANERFIQNKYPHDLELWNKFKEDTSVFKNLPEEDKTKIRDMTADAMANIHNLKNIAASSLGPVGLIAKGFIGDKNKGGITPQDILAGLKEVFVFDKENDTQKFVSKYKPGMLEYLSDNLGVDVATIGESGLNIKGDNVGATLEFFKGLASVGGNVATGNFTNITKVFGEHFEKAKELQKQADDGKNVVVARLDPGDGIVLAGDILADPLTYIPFGALTSVLKSPLRMAKKPIIRMMQGLSKASKAENTIGRTLNNMGKLYDGASTIAKKAFNVSKLVDKELGLAIDNFLANKQISSKTAAKIAANPEGFLEGEELLSAVSKFSKEEATEMGLKLHQISDEAQKLFLTEYGNETMMQAKDVALALDLKSLINSAKKNPEKGEEIVKEINQQLMLANIKTAGDLTYEMITNGKYKKFFKDIRIKKGTVNPSVKSSSRKIANAEHKATSAVAKAEYLAENKGIKDALSFNKQELKKAQKAFRQDGRMAFQILKDDFDAFTSNLKTLDKEVSKAINSEVIDPSFLREGITKLKERINSITDMEMADTKMVIDIAKGRKDLQHLRKSILEIENNYNRAILGGVDDLKILAPQMQLAIKELKDSSKVYLKYRRAEILDATKKFRQGIYSSEKLTNELGKKFAGHVQDLLKDRDKLQIAAKSLAENYLLKKMKNKRMISDNAEKYSIMFNAIFSGKFAQGVKKSIRGKQLKLIDDMTAHLPDDQKNTIKAMINAYQEYAHRGVREGFLHEGVLDDIYFPRISKKGFFQEFKTMFEGSSGASTKGFTKKRKLGYSNEWREHVLKEGGIPIDDAEHAMFEYIDDFEKTSAKHALTQSFLTHYGVDKVGKLPKDVKYALDFYTEAGNAGGLLSTIQFANKFIEPFDRLSKLMFTAINPAFVSRNVMGFPHLIASTAGMKQGFNPANYAESALILSGKDGVLNIGKNRYTYRQIREAMNKTGYFDSSFFRTNPSKGFDKAIRRGSKLDPRTWVTEYTSLASKSEDWGRTSALLANLKNGRSMDEAIKLSKKAMFDYNFSHSPVEKALQAMTLFYSFSRRNLPQQIRTMFKDPKQYSIMSSILKKVSGREDLSEEELSTLNKYDNSSLQFFSPAVDGTRFTMNLGFLPIEEAYSTANLVTDLALNLKMDRMPERINPSTKLFLSMFYGDTEANRDFPTGYLDEKFGNVMNKLPKSVLNEMGLEISEKDKWDGGKKVGKKNVVTSFTEGGDRVIRIIKNLPLGRQLGDLKYLQETGDFKGYLSGMKTKKFLPKDRKSFKKYLVKKKAVEFLKKSGKIK
jgi:hypothetical protein